MIKETENPRKESARRRATRKWSNHDLRRRYKEAKQANAEELEPPKTTVVTVVNPVYDEMKEYSELLESNRRKFVAHMKKLVAEGREQGIKKYKFSIEQQKRRLLIAKYKILMARQKENAQKII
jgi:hypothetical protein